jgi:hypothetical protein
MFTRHRLGPTNKLDCPHAMGTDAFSPQRAESFRYFLLQPSPSTFTFAHKQQQVPPLRGSSPQTMALAMICSGRDDKVRKYELPIEPKSGIEWATCQQLAELCSAGRARAPVPTWLVVTDGNTRSLDFARDDKGGRNGCARMRTGGGKALSGGGTAPLKPKAGLNGPPSCCPNSGRFWRVSI